MKAFWDFILAGRFSEGLHNLMAFVGYSAITEVYLVDAHTGGLNVEKTLCYAAIVCGIPTLQAGYAKWLRAPADPQTPAAGAPS